VYIEIRFFECRVKQGSKGQQPLGGVWGVPTFSLSPGWGGRRNELSKGIDIKIVALTERIMEDEWNES